MQIRSVNELAAMARSRRRELGWSQTQLAEAVGVGRTWIVTFEQGKSSVELGLVLRTLRALRLSLDLGPAAESSQSRHIDLGELLGETRNSPES